MRYVKFDDIEIGMVLAKPLYGDNGGVLVKEGCAISENIFRHIDGTGIQGIYIKDELTQDIQIEDIVSEKLRNIGVEALINGDYNKCVAVAKAITKEMSEQSYPLYDMMDIKTFKNYEYRHCLSVAVYSVAVGLHLKLNQEQLNGLAIAGILHDIGKFDVKKRVMKTKQVYNEKQMDEMKKHPTYSYEAVKDNPNVSSVSRNAILYHHENVDGTGYYGITQDKLVLFPRILRVVDTYDALLSTRMQRKAFGPDYAFKHLVDNSGKLYDLDVVKAFVYTLPMYPRGFTVKLTNGETAVVVKNNTDIERPIVRLLNGQTIDLSKDANYRQVEIEVIV